MGTAIARGLSRRAVVRTKRRFPRPFSLRALPFLAAIVMACSSTAAPGEQSTNRYTPVARTAAPSVSLVPAPAGCQAGAVRVRVETFFAAFNRGDASALNDALSRAFVWYSIGPPEPRTVFDREGAIRYFVERAAAGERLSLASIEVSPYLADGQVGFALVITRDFAGTQLHHKGKGSVYCGSGNTPGILLFSFAPADP